MIPLIMRLRVRKTGRKAVNLWLPVILALIPVILLLIAIFPLVLVASLLARIGGQGGMVLRLYALLFVVLFMMSGLRIEVGRPEDEFAIILQ